MTKYSKSDNFTASFFMVILILFFPKNAKSEITRIACYNSAVTYYYKRLNFLSDRADADLRLEFNSKHKKVNQFSNGKYVRTFNHYYLVDNTIYAYDSKRYENIIMENRVRVDRALGEALYSSWSGTKKNLRKIGSTRFKCLKYELKI
jgi:hypothetical protein